MKEWFLEIWNERPHVCNECDQDLGLFPLSYFFSHILGRQSYPKFKKLKKNITFHCFKCHRIWEFGDRKSLKKTYSQYEILKEEYYNEYP